MSQPSVVDLIQEYVVRTGVAPGARLPTVDEFAAELGVARSGVREAIQALQALGIVEVRHGRGTYLRDDSSLDGLANALTFWSRHSQGGVNDGQTLRRMTEVRMALETTLVHQVVGHHTTESLELMTVAVDEMDSLAKQGAYAPAADRDFHHALYRPLDNWILDGILHSFWQAVRRSAGDDAFVNDPHMIADNHRDIVEAVRDHDHAALVAAMTAHFDPMENWVGKSAGPGQ